MSCDSIRGTKLHLFHHTNERHVSKCLLQQYVVGKWWTIYSIFKCALQKCEV